MTGSSPARVLRRDAGHTKSKNDRSNCGWKEPLHNGIIAQPGTHLCAPPGHVRLSQLTPIFGQSCLGETRAGWAVTGIHTYLDDGRVASGAQKDSLESAITLHSAWAAMMPTTQARTRSRDGVSSRSANRPAIKTNMNGTASSPNPSPGACGLAAAITRKITNTISGAVVPKYRVRGQAM